MNHYEHAPAWYIQAARAHLDAAGIPAAQDYYDNGRTPGVYADAINSGKHNRVTILVATGTKRTLHEKRPRPGSTRDTWDAACDRVAAALAERGYGTPTRIAMGLVLDSPTPPAGPVVELTPSPVLGEVGKYTARIIGHPDLGASIEASFHVPTSPGYYYATGRSRRMGGVHTTPEEAAWAYAYLCGFPPATIRHAEKEAR